MNQQDFIDVLSIETLFDGTEYIIPIYQRNYAWGEAQITQLIEDVLDSSKHRDQETGNQKVYYIGSLVTFKREEENRTLYETIDGQQRLTTLNILLSALKNQYSDKVQLNPFEFNLRFDSREVSSRTLRSLYQYGLQETSIKLNPSMVQAYEIVLRKLQEKFSEQTEYKGLQEFVDYLMKLVKILRIQVPEKTDLNHYFEVMNNRGEQLEKHEILKARCLDILTEKQEGTNELSDESERNRRTFHLIWESCAQMDRYMQYAYHIDIRKNIFGPDWDRIPGSYDEVNELTNRTTTTSDGTDGISCKDLLGQAKVDPPNVIIEEDDGQAQFTPVVSFSNFILHVLRISSGQDVQLDDKKLIQEFEKYVLDVEGDSKEQKIQRVKDFAYALFKSKHLFDQYIVKRAYRNGKDQWNILRLKKQDGANRGYYVGTFGDETDEGTGSINKRLTMLLSMFHVSFPQTIYKHWLTGALLYLYTRDGEIEANAYLHYLEKMSDAFLFDRLQRTERDYFEIIFTNKCAIQNEELLPTDIAQNLNIGTNVQNFIFNRIDYRLWLDFNTHMNQIENKDVDYLKVPVNRFEFGFRSSVEHYAPQHPKNKQDALSNVDDFGNLCLISRSKNSELSNYSPRSKKEHYSQQKTVESLKQRLMMCYANWDESTVEDHQQKMVEVLKIKTKI
ncbi:MAG: DUF262 domain-containing protein [Crocinitomicaceae bacterium]|nr:DUF262 domain-containing protein [Crocinitomicaceae bacterium]